MKPITNSNILILLQAAEKLNLKTSIIQSHPPIINLIHQNQTHRISEKSLGINTNSKAKTISKNKALTLKTLKQASLPTPQHTVIHQPQDYPSTLKTIPFPQVIKPLTGEKGQYIFLNIKDKPSGQQAVNQILDHYPEGCIIESHHQGDDYRFLLLNHQLIGLSQRLSPTITGNGQNTIKQLIETENLKRRQQYLTTGKRLLNRMRNWPRLKWNLEQQNLSLNTILPQGKTIILYPIPNFSTGGSVKTIDPQSIHPELIKLANQASKTIGLDIIGIDMLIKDLNQPPKNNAVIIEVNSDPGLRLHDWPNQDQPQHVAEIILKSIFSL